MKTKLQILAFLMMLFSLIVVPSVSVSAANETDTPIISIGEELPSSSYLQREKRSIANTLESSSFITPLTGLLRAGENWKDPFMAAQDGETSWPGNVGDKGPIENISFPIIMSILLLYLIYRRVTISRRRNNL